MNFEGMELLVAITNSDDITHSLWSNKWGCYMYLQEDKGDETFRDYYMNYEAMCEEIPYYNNLRRLIKIWNILFDELLIVCK